MDRTASFIERGPVIMGRTAGTVMAATYTMGAFLGAFLLFLVEPMVTKMLLPMLGGSPSVWNTATVFFQGTLLLGYAWAHVTLRRLAVSVQSVVFLALLVAVALVLPVAVPAGWLPPEGGNPAWWALATLAVMVGAPFFVLASVGPTLQRWFSRTVHPHASDPYFLYAASNAGSLLGLLAYPFLLEPRLDLTTQSRLWTALYVGFIGVSGTCALLLRRYASAVDAGESDRHRAIVAAGPAVPARTRLRWVYLALIPSALMLGVTRHIATDIASVPLLWVVPLSLYLATFIVAFGREPERAVRVASRAFRILVIPMTLGFLGLVPSLWLELPLQLAGFTAAALVAHARLASERPDPAGLTGFFLMISIGGAVGGVFAALVAPLLFRTVLEYPLAIVMALCVLPPMHATNGLTWWRRRPTTRTLALGIGAVALGVGTIAIRAQGSQHALKLSMTVAAFALAGAYVLVRGTAGYAAVVGGFLLAAAMVPAYPTLYAQRTFFGVHRVERLPGGAHVLLNGTTVHGIQNVDRSGRLVDIPAAYYGPSGPAGDVFGSLAERGPMQIGVIGSGAGALAAYTRPGDRLTYYEIDPAVVHVATDPALFSYVPDARGAVRFEIGDGRIRLQQDAGSRYDVLVVDAFSSDAIPTHLLTEQAIGLYVARLDDHGLLVFNVSNRYFDLVPVLARIARQERLVGIVRDDVSITPAQAAAQMYSSEWVVLARSPDDLSTIARDPGWVPIGPGNNAPLWTDGFTDLLGALR